MRLIHNCICRFWPNSCYLKGIMKRFLIIASGLLSALYLLNPGFGIFEIIPDTLPIVGNLDEGAAAYVLFSTITYLLGKNFGMFSKEENPAEASKTDTIEDRT